MKELKFDFHHYYSTPGGGYKSGVTVFAFHTMRMQAYQDDWSLKEIVVFEIFLNRSRRFNHEEFFYQQKRLMEESRLTEYSLRQCIEKLKDLKLISVTREKGSTDKKNYYQVDFDAIKNNLDVIYDFDKFPADARDMFIEMFKNFYSYFEQGKPFRKEGNHGLEFFAGANSNNKPKENRGDIVDDNET